MNRKELAHQLAESENLSDSMALRIVTRLFDVIEEAIIGDDTVVIRNFGRFETRIRKPIRRVNPKNGQEMLVPERRTVGFKPSPLMKTRVNGKEGQESSTDSRPSPSD